MYGYVVVNKPELRFREYDVYRSYYCGLCDALGEEHGQLAKTTLSYDFTFLVILLTGLYEPEVTVCEKRCPVHPAKKHTFRKSTVTDYVADMDILLAYYKCLDDWNDDRSVKGRFASAHFRKSARLVSEKYPKKAEVIKAELARLAEFEASNETDIDAVSSTFGNIMAEVMVMKSDEWEPTIRQMGFYLGKYIYILDAYDDLETDIKKKHYNMLVSWREREDFEEMILGILNGCLSQCARYFQYLPIVQDAEILKNIIFSGVWVRYGQIKNRRSKKKDR